MSTSVTKRQAAAVILMAAAWGWADGNFVPDGGITVPNIALHLIPIVLLLIFGVPFLSATSPAERARASVGVTVVAILSVIGTTVMIVLGQTNPDPNSVGVKTIADWIPAIFELLGSFLWLSTMIPSRRTSSQSVASGR